jgi:hypothetical protein
MRGYEKQREPGDPARLAPPAAHSVVHPGAVGPQTALTPAMVLALQRSVGNAAVVRLLAQQRHTHDASCGHQDRSQDQSQAASPAPVQRSSVHEVLRSPGQPLPEPVRTEMEARLGADFGSVRLHEGPAAARSAAEVGARAYTSDEHVVIGAGGGDKHTLAHELTHVLQQRTGPVAGTDTGTGLSVSDPSDRFERAAEANAHRVMAGPTPVQRHTPDAPDPHTASPGQGTAVQRAKVFTPFTGMARANVSLAGHTMDTLEFHGLTYPKGSTAGNSVSLERMLNNGGGSSSPGEPADVWEIRKIDQALVAAKGQTNAATAMHAINGDFTAGANDEPRNIFMGSALSNTSLHYWRVEDPIRKSMQSGKAGQAKAYEAAMAAKPPTELINHPGVFAWNDTSVTIPGAETGASFLKGLNPAPLPKLTHAMDQTTPTASADSNKWPKMIRYNVTPNYTYGAHPNWPAFLLANVAKAQKLVDIEEAKPLTDKSRADQNAIDEEKRVIALLKQRAHLLFPETFTCTANYWLASYNPAAPWYRSTDTDFYDAEL